MRDQLEVLFFAQLKEELGCDSCSIEIDGEVSIYQLKQRLAAQNENWLKSFSGKKLLAAINQQMVGDEAIVKASDEVAFFPPVTGG